MSFINIIIIIIILISAILYLIRISINPVKHNKLIIPVLIQQVAAWWPIIRLTKNLKVCI